MKAITVLDVAKGRGVKDNGGGIALGAIEAVGLPFFGGCEVCGASIAVYNASPTTTGYLRCTSGCVGDLGFHTVEGFEAWIRYMDAESEHHNPEPGHDEWE